MPYQEDTLIPNKYFKALDIFTKAIHNQKKHQCIIFDEAFVSMRKSGYTEHTIEQTTKLLKSIAVIRGRIVNK